MKIRKLIALFLVYTFFVLDARSPHRLVDPETPSLRLSFQGQAESWYLKDTHLQIGPYFHLFDEKHFFNNMLPSEKIIYRNNTGSISSSRLSEITHQFLQEILEKKPPTQMEIIKKKDFDKQHTTGLIIAKFKDYPFVIKLFIETPESLTHPFEKGFEPWCFFMLGGGTNRHLMGFTRLKNRAYVLEKISQNPYYTHHIDFPRKWFWLPKNPQWIEIEGNYFNTHTAYKKRIPAIYALICDYIDIERTFSLKNQTDRRIALQLSNYLQQVIDPHINNFVIEKKTKKLVLLDTEHFPTLVGYESPPHCKSYVQWYTHLSSNALYSIYGCLKSERKARQRKAYQPPPALNIAS